MRIKSIERFIAKKLIRTKESHKGDYGHVLLIVGNRTMAGAAVLSSLAALRSGAGLVTVAVPESIVETIRVSVPEALCVPLPEARTGTIAYRGYSVIKPYLRDCSVVALGPGLTVMSETKRFIIKVLETITVPLVLDADGLNAIKDRVEMLAKIKSSVIITPHPKEFARLNHCSVDAIQQDRSSYARQFSETYGCVVVLKGYRTIIADRKKVSYNTTGNAGMATGGSGDVLTGICAAFLGQHDEPYDMARAAVYIHGLAADLAVKDMTEVSLIARDIINYIPRCFKKVGL